MKKNKNRVHEGRMLKEYDFSHGVRGKYASRYKTGSNVIVLDPDVASVFGSSESVNRILRPLAEMMNQKG